MTLVRKDRFCLLDEFSGLLRMPLDRVGETVYIEPLRSQFYEPITFVGILRKHSVFAAP